MFPPSPAKSHSLSFIIGALLCAAGFASAAGPAFELIGAHPASNATPFPAIHSIVSYQGRMYMGYGDWNSYPAVIMTSYDPADRLFHLEHSVGSDSVGVMRVLGDTLWVPHADPVHAEDFEEFSRKSGGVWHEQSPLDSIHAFDFAQASDGSLFISAAAGNNAILARSVDGGLTWRTVITDTSRIRYYWCFILNDRAYVEGISIPVSGPVVRQSNALSTYPDLYKPVTLNPPGKPAFAVALDNRVTGLLDSGSKKLLSFDGTATALLLPSVRDFALDGEYLYVMDARPGIVRARIAAREELVFEDLLATGLPANAYSFCVDGGQLYVGTRDGKLFGARTDAGPVAALGTVNDMPPAHGRGLSFYGTELAVGSPDALRNGLAMSGEARVLTEPSAPGQAWTASEAMPAPQPDFSGWFGKKLALRGDLLAVVETGADATNRERGTSARVVIHRRTAGVWSPVVTLPVPFAHSATFSESGEWLAVGTANSSSNQDAGTPGIHVYRITRPAAGPPVFERQTQLRPASGWGYKPVVRVAFQGNRVIGGFAGDPSRNGGPGTVGMWVEDPAAPGKFMTAPAWSVRDATGSRFGYSVAVEGDWIAAGAPRAEAGTGTATVRNTGRVSLYRFSENGLPAAAGTLACPDPQDGADFGYAVALRGSTLLVGAPGKNDGADWQRGAVYVYRLVENAWVLSGRLTRPENSLRRFGTEVAIGDVWMAASSRASRPGTGALESLAFERRPDPGTGFDNWLATLAPALSGAASDADPDANGYSLLMEYVLGLRPGAGDFAGHPASAHHFGLGAVTWSDGLPGLAHAFPANDPRLTVTVTGSEDLEEWAPSPLPAEELGTEDGFAKWRQPFPSAPARWFFRMESDYKRE